MTSQSYLSTVTRCAWRGPSLLVADADGWVGRHTLSGFYFREARFLSELRLELFGERPYLCSTAEARPELLQATYVYPHVEERGGGGSGSGGSGEVHGLLFRDLDLDLRYRVRPASLSVHLQLASAWQDADVELAWHLGADYADLIEATADRREQEAGVEAEAEPGGVVFRYGHPALPYRTRVIVGGLGEWAWRDGALRGRLHLPRQHRVELVLTVYPEDFEDPLDREDEEARERRLAAWEERRTRVEGRGDLPLARLTNEGMRDLGSLALLEGREGEWLAPAAGIPLYPALFGRDAFTMGWQAAVLDRGEILAESYDRLADLQGRRVDPWRDEEPGRAVQQSRRGPLARLGTNPFSRYYGDYAAPMMFLISLGQMYAWSGDKELLRRHWDDARRVLDWAREFGDLDGDGYLEYETLSPLGPEHQGWKDSDNAVVYADGSQAEPPVSACEVQAYWYAALQILAVVSAVLGELGEARGFYRESRELKERFNRDFWMEEEGLPAFGLDADKRHIGAIASNAGQCLVAGILDDDKVPAVVERLFRPDLYSGWGIRTLSTDNPAYQPISYHLGSVWPSENASILFGLRRYGEDERTLELAEGLYALAGLWRGGRVPECVGGYARSERDHPGCYPHANVPQGWNQSAWPLLVQALLGLRPVASLHLLAVDPILPEWAPELTLRGLRVGEAVADIRFRRDDDGKSHYEVLSTEGTLHVVRQPPLDSLHAGLWDRLGTLVKDVLPFG